MDLCRQILCLELLISRYHQKVKCCLLPVAQKQILADHCAERFVDIRTLFHRHCRLMINPLIFDIQFVQKIVRPDFFSQTSRAVGRTSLL